MGTGFAKKKKEMRAMQAQFGALQAEMQTLEVTGSAGNGLVTLVLSGEGDLRSIKISPVCIDKEDPEGLETLVRAAHADAQKKIKEKTNAQFPKF